MYLQEIFEVVLGLVFIWLILSTATMQLGEWIANAFRWRAADLERGIRRMLGDDDLTRLFYDHPLIRSLSEAGTDGDTRPSYIPANKFSTVLLSIIQDAETEAALMLRGLYTLFPRLTAVRSVAIRKQAHTDLERLVELARLSMSSTSDGAMNNLMITTLQKEIGDLGSRFPELKASSQAVLEKVQAQKAEIDALIGSLPNAAAPGGDFQKALRGSLALRVTDPGLRLTLSSLLIGIEDRTADCFGVLRSNIESWFNDSMDRLSGHYKRKAQWTAFAIGMAVAMLLNVDTISVSNQLWREPILRQAINANALQVVSQTSGQATPPLSDLILSLQDQYLNVSLPIGWTFSANAALEGSACAFGPIAGTTFGLPVNGGCLHPVDTSPGSNSWLWTFTKLLGVVMTALAAMQGSSFWFDVLVKIVNVRGAGIKPV